MICVKTQISHISHQQASHELHIKRSMPFESEMMLRLTALTVLDVDCRRRDRLTTIEQVDFNINDLTLLVVRIGFFNHLRKTTSASLLQVRPQTAS